MTHQVPESVKEMLALFNTFEPPLLTVGYKLRQIGRTDGGYITLYVEPIEPAP
jgi:hypothetical protein